MAAGRRWPSYLEDLQHYTSTIWKFPTSEPEVSSQSRVVPRWHPCLIFKHNTEKLLATHNDNLNQAKHNVIPLCTMSELHQQPSRWKPLTMVRKSVANVIHDAMAASSQGWIHFERSWPEHILQRIITLNEQHLAKRQTQTWSWTWRKTTTTEY